MGVRSDICAIFRIESENVQEFKNKFKAYLISIMDDSNHTYYIIKHFFQTDEVTKPDKIGFCYFDESIKFDYLKDGLNEFFNFLESFDFTIDFEAKELCTEYLELDNFTYSRKSKDNDYEELYLNCVLGGVPETTNIKLIDWISS